VGPATRKPLAALAAGKESEQSEECTSFNSFVISSATAGSSITIHCHDCFRDLSSFGRPIVPDFY
jgi:hypothetical protein